MKQANKNPHNLRALDRYSILYKKDFDPNAEGLLLFRKDVEKEHLGIYLVSLCKQFYERQEEEIRLLEESVIVEEYAVDQLMSYHQCPACHTIYIPEMGDEAQQVRPGTSFESLPECYSCPLCEMPKAGFVEVKGAIPGAEVV